MYLEVIEKIFWEEGEKASKHNMLQKAHALQTFKVISLVFGERPPLDKHLF
jgi:hypothetical protein